MKAYQKTENIALYGKGKKLMKPLLKFSQLGFPSNIMSVCAGFAKPTPIQVSNTDQFLLVQLFIVYNYHT